LVPKPEERKLLVNIHAQLGHLSERCSLNDVSKAKVIEFRMTFIFGNHLSFLKICLFKRILELTCFNLNNNGMGDLERGLIQFGSI